MADLVMNDPETRLSFHVAFEVTRLAGALRTATRESLTLATAAGA